MKTHCGESWSDRRERKHRERRQYLSGWHPYFVFRKRFGSECYIFHTLMRRLSYLPDGVTKTEYREFMSDIILGVEMDYPDRYV